MGKLFPTLHWKGKDKKNLEAKQQEEALQRALSPYLKREDLIKVLNSIRSEEKKRELWNNLSPRTRIKLIRYLINKQGGKGNERI